MFESHAGTPGRETKTGRRVRRHALLRAASVAVAVGSVTLLAAACSTEPKPGESCSGLDTRCYGKDARVVCVLGTFVEWPCKGPAGCKVEGECVSCDISGNAAGTPCPASEDGTAACRADQPLLVQCRGGKYVERDCRGPKGCYRVDNTSRCDQSVALEGDACQGSLPACSLDKKQLLKCESGTFRLQAHCDGPEGCSIGHEGIACDKTMGDDAKPR